MKTEVKLYGGLDNHMPNPTGYGDELAVIPDKAMTGTISEDYVGTTPLEIGDQVQVYPLGDAYDGALVAYGEVTVVDEDGEGNIVITFDKEIDEENGNNWYSEVDYDICKIDLKNPEHQKRLKPTHDAIASKPIFFNGVSKKGTISEDLSGTTASIAVPEHGQGVMKRNNQKPAYGYSYLKEDVESKIANLKKAIANYYDRKSKTTRGTTEHKICVKRIIDAEDDLKRLEREAKSLKKEAEYKKGYEPENIARIKARPDYQDMQRDLRTICKTFGLDQNGESLVSQITKRNPVYQKEMLAACKELCAKYNLTLQTLGLEEDYDYSAEERDYVDKQDLQNEDYDYSSEEVGYTNKQDYDQLRQDIVNTYDSIIDSGIDKDTAIGQIAVKFRQDPEYIKVLVENQIKNLKKEVMTEKEIKTKRLLESYGVITKSKAPLSEEDDEESEKDEDGKKEDEDEEKDEKKSKGPKKGVNPFTKKDDKEDDSEEEEETEEDEYEFKGAGSEVCVYGVDYETAKGLAAKMLAPLNDLIAPKGTYKITFEASEEETEEEF